MLYKYDNNSKQLIPLEETSFATHNIMERQHIEKWVEEEDDEEFEEKMKRLTSDLAGQFEKSKELGKRSGRTWRA